MKLHKKVAHSVGVLGRYAPAKLVHSLYRTADIAETFRLAEAAGFNTRIKPVPQREVLATGLRLASSARSPLYLEFGVAKGNTMRRSSKQLTTPGARLVGFDSFEGLPERCSMVIDKGAFAQGGNEPVIDDDRITFVKGLFDETLPTYEAPDHDLMIVNVDCDIYSSTATVLEWCDTRLAVGDLVYFDEYNYPAHEGRAFHEFIERTGFRFELIAASGAFSATLFRRTA